MPRSLNGLRVLVVDDCQTTLSIVSEYIATWKGIARIAPDATSGLEALRVAAREKNPFHVAVLDWRMPGVDGVTMAHLIKEDPALSTTGLVLLSGFGQLYDSVEEAKSPFAAFVPKPARASELYDAIVTAANGSSGLARNPKPVPAPATLGSTRPTRGGVVLLAEDNEINREVAGEIIRELGYTCLHAVNGREAVEVVQAGSVDLVLMDCQMPIMDGYEATGIIREWERTEAEPTRRRPVPIIALTAHAMKEDRDVCLRAGMDDFLTKPLDPDDLADTLMKWMGAADRESDAQEAPAATEDVPVSAAAPVGPSTLPPPAPTGDPIDFPSLVHRCMGKTSLAERLVQTFLTLVRPYAQDVADAVAQQDPVALRDSAHRLKGSAASVSALLVSQIAAELEVLGTENNLGPAPDLSRRLSDEVDRLIKVHDGKDYQVA